MSAQRPDDSKTSVDLPAQTTRSAEDKFRLLVASGSLEPDALGALLRREGVLQTELDQRRADVLAALTDRRAEAAQVAIERRRVQLLERELARKERALAEAAALLILEKNWSRAVAPPVGEKLRDAACATTVGGPGRSGR